MLKNEKGLLPKVESRRGKVLPEEIRDRAINFYQSEEFSRMCPGKKEFVSVKIDGVKQHMQKHLLLIDLKEPHLEFKKATDIKIGFSKFCELQPKWCILVGNVSGAIQCVFASTTKMQSLWFLRYQVALIARS